MDRRECYKRNTDFCGYYGVFVYFERILNSYQNTPRTYGTKELLYMTEAHVIKEIGDNPGLNLNELAEQTYRTKSAMSTMLKGLVKRLVERKR